MRWLPSMLGNRIAPARWMLGALALILPLRLVAVERPQAVVSSPNRHHSEVLVRRFWDAFNRAAWSELDDLVAPSYTHHPPGKTLTLAQFKAGGSWVHKGLAKYRLTIDSMVLSDTEVAVRWTARGIHAGSFFGEVPTHGEVEVHGMTFHAISDGRISEDWEVIDFDGFKKQLQRP